MDKPEQQRLTPGAREAALRYAIDEKNAAQAESFSEHALNRAFLAGYSAALSPPTPEEIKAVAEVYFGKGGAQIAKHDDPGFANLGAAILAFLEGRK